LIFFLHNVWYIYVHFHFFLWTFFLFWTIHFVWPDILFSYLFTSLFSYCFFSFGWSCSSLNVFYSTPAQSFLS
jgi:hypothetical protein